MSTREMIISESNFRGMFSSIADNQIQFCCSLIQFFIKDQSGKSKYMSFKLDGADLIEDAMPEWKQRGWHRKISAYAIFPAMVRLLEYVCQLQETDPSAVELFQEVFGSVQAFYEVIVDLLRRVEKFEQLMSLKMKKAQMSCTTLLDYEDGDIDNDSVKGGQANPKESEFLHILLDSLLSAPDLEVHKTVSIFSRKNEIVGLNVNSGQCKAIFGLTIPPDVLSILDQCRVYLVKDDATDISGPKSQLRCILM